jgi:hypothetical protein
VIKELAKKIMFSHSSPYSPDFSANPPLPRRLHGSGKTPLKRGLSVELRGFGPLTP